MARPIPRPEPVISATRSLSTIRPTRIEGRRVRVQAGVHCGLACSRLAGQQLYLGSGANPWLRTYYGRAVFTWARFQGIFLWATFYVFARLIAFIPASNSILGPAT